MLLCFVRKAVGVDERASVEPFDEKMDSDFITIFRDVEAKGLVDGLAEGFSITHRRTERRSI